MKVSFHGEREENENANAVGFAAKRITRDQRANDKSDDARQSVALDVATLRADFDTISGNLAELVSLTRGLLRPTPSIVAGYFDAAAYPNAIVAVQTFSARQNRDAMSLYIENRSAAAVNVFAGGSQFGPLVAKVSTATWQRFPITSYNVKEFTLTFTGQVASGLIRWALTSEFWTPSQGAAV